MTSDGILAEDWDKVHELALTIVNADDDALAEHYTREMLRCLDTLIAKYGKKASLLATRADYVDDPTEAETLLLAAYDVALVTGDAKNLSSISHSLVDLYVTRLFSADEAKRWLPIAEGHSLHGRTSWREDLGRLRLLMAEMWP